MRNDAATYRTEKIEVLLASIQGSLQLTLTAIAKSAMMNLPNKLEIRPCQIQFQDVFRSKFSRVGLVDCQ